MNGDTKQSSTGLKLGLFVGFVVVWLILAFVGSKAVGPFREGGWGMWPILAVGMVFIIITIDRVRYLYGRAATDTRVFVAQVQKQLMHGDVAGALAYCRASQQPLGHIVAAGLETLNRPDVEVQEAVDEAALYELPRIETRTGYLAMIGNIATLLGLLGTIVGLIKSFAGVSLGNVSDPATIEKAKQYVHLVKACQGITNAKDIVKCIDMNKATILAQGISEAMNCTAFGLCVGILSLLAFSILNGRTQTTLDKISESTVYLMNLAAGNRRAMKLS